jgi:outer membrane protein OmpA-like peptidoglycan-associated protein
VIVVRVCIVALLGLATSGCSLLRGSPAPPPPPPPEINAVAAEEQSPAAQIERGDEGDAVGFEPLIRARAAVAEAREDAAVTAHAQDAMAHAETALAAAQATWEEIAGAPSKRPDALAAIGHDSHLARRWAEIAMAEGARQADLAEIERVRLALARREAEDERWLGTELVPGMYGDITFALGTARLDPGSGDVIDELVEFLKVHPRYALEIRGHTDASAPAPGRLRRFLDTHPEVAERAGDPAARIAAYNRAMSLRRAETVLRILAEAGIDESRLSAKGFGASRPVADSETAAGHRQNRRVEVLVVPALGWAGG